MTARERLLHTWQEQLTDLLVGMDPRRTRVFATLVLGLLWAGSVALPRIAAAAPGALRDRSRERALSRWVQNPRVDVEAIWRRVRPALLASRGDREVTVVFDLSPQGTEWTALVFGVVTHGRALPIAGRILPQREPWGVSLEELLRPLVADIAAAMPAGCAVTLVVDRGLTGVSLIDLCRAVGWHWVLRVNTGPAQANRVQLAGGGEEPLWALVARLGRRGTEAARLFKGAGWRAGWVTVHWGAYAERWVLFSDRPGGQARVRDYRRRWTIEPMFQDGTQRGWDLERSRLRDPERLTRLLLGVQVMLWWLMQLGLRAIRHGERRRFDHPTRRDMSVVKIGRRVHQTREAEGRRLPLPFARRHGQWRHATYA